MTSKFSRPPAKEVQRAAERKQGEKNWQNYSFILAWKFLLFLRKINVLQFFSWISRFFILPVLPVFCHPVLALRSTINSTGGIMIYTLGIWSQQMNKCFIGVFVFCDPVRIRINRKLYISSSSFRILG